MGDGAVPPGSTNRHYEAVAGDRDQRLQFYLAQRYFNKSPEEWQRLPWWQTQLYIEGLREEGIIKSPEGGGASSIIDPTVDAPLPQGFQTRRVG